MRLLLSLLLVVLVAGPAKTQTVITGVVSSPQEPLAYAQVSLPAQKSGVLTNTDGRFQLTVPQFPAVLVVRMLGYRADTLHLREAPTADLRITLREQAIQLAEVAIRSDQNYGLVLAQLALARLQDTLPEPPASEAGLYRMFAFDEGQAIEVQEIFLGSTLKPHRNTYKRTLTGRFGRLPKDSIRGAGPNFHNFSRLTFLPYALAPVKRFASPLSPQGIKGYEFKFDGFVEQDGRTLGLVSFTRKPKGKGQGYQSGRLYIDRLNGDLYGIDGNLMDIVNGGIFLKEGGSQMRVRHVLALGPEGRTRVTQCESELTIGYGVFGKRGTIRVETIYYVLPQLPANLLAQVPAQARALSKKEAIGSEERRLVASSTYLPAFWAFAAQTIQPTPAQAAVLGQFEQRGYFLQPGAESR